ncbi:tRNA-(MS[2]IO[6]A)-hydroxylase (MiaE) [Vibrio palustris]|uniref:tRNA-(MS[2]IO[6]A)-hydroxylase (MiaE) n=2 Tax=Vibrio palustris TaxID=1918946 RepID=A0A1R4B1Q9_9VIBR|nr:tRNA-(MS[2]IO[6]A)-hydroxylase (MiaE) [Vibrio palustris]
MYTLMNFMMKQDTINELLSPIQHFLSCPTPQAWLDEACKPKNLRLLLLDHLMCELKAGQSAMYLIRKYAVDQDSQHSLLEWFKPYEDFVYRGIGSLETLKDKSQISKRIFAKSNSPYSQELIDKMVLLIKEELHHFYQVLEIMTVRDISYESIPASRYAKGMLSHMRTYEPEALIDKLIIGAYIEARSCERFARLAPLLDNDLARFYGSLLRSEARHYQDYLALAKQIAGTNINDRIAYIGRVEADLIQTPDDELRFHSGTPSWE